LSKVRGRPKLPNLSKAFKDLKDPKVRGLKGFKVRKVPGHKARRVRAEVEAAEVLSAFANTLSSICLDRRHPLAQATLRVAGIIANRQAASYQYTSASSGSFAGLNGGSTATNAQWVFGRNINFFCEACLGQTVTERMWLGVFDIALTTTTLAGSDTTHSNQYAAFRYSTTAGDSDWQCVTCDGTTQNVVSSGVAVDTKSHRFLIVINDSIPNVLFIIDGTTVATLTTNLPTTSAVNAYYVTGLASTAAVNSDFFWTQVQLQADY
jgi:hypothetical protein